MKKDVSGKKLGEKTPTATEITTEIVGQRSQKEPPLSSPNWPKSEFDKLCAEHGGPANLGIEVDHRVFQRYCGEFTLPQLLPVLRQVNSPTTRFRHVGIGLGQHLQLASTTSRSKNERNIRTS